MPQFTSGTTLEYMVARVLATKPNASQSEVVNALNARIRTAIDARIYWSDLLVQRVISFPGAYTTGTVSFTTGSNVATLSGTSYPYNDIVNTTTTTLVYDAGFQEITPVTMAGISVDTLLYVDSSGTPEVVAVVEVTGTSFWAQFQYPHTASGWTLWSSSLSGLQLNSGYNNPIFDVLALTSTQTIIMNQPWGGPALSASSYQILKLYTTIDPLLKVILSVIDTQQAIALDIYTPIEKLDQLDPQRTSQQNPLIFAQHTPSPAGSMRYEVYPSITTPYQLRAIVGLQWPDLKYDTDRAPWFLDSNLFVTGACADVLRQKNTRYGANDDPWFNPQLAMEYEQLYHLKLQDAVNADEAKAQRAFTNSMASFGLPGIPAGNYWLGHDPDLVWRLF